MAIYRSRNRMIVRRRPSDLSGFMDKLKDAAKGALDYYKKSEQAKGAAAAATPPVTPYVAPAQSSVYSIPLSHIAIGGGVLLLAVVALRKSS